MQTQFAGENLRQFVRSHNIDQLDNYEHSDRLRHILLVMSRYIKDNYADTEKGQNFYKYVIDNRELLPMLKLAYSIIPYSRFGRSSRPNIILNNDTTKLFLKALNKIYNEPKNNSYLGLGTKTYDVAYVEDLLNEYYPIFSNGFYPVFEIDIYNNGSESILINDLSAIVEDVKEYAGIAEVISETEIFTISLDKKKGEYFSLKKPSVIIESGKYQRILIRLTTTANESSYKLKLKIYSKDGFLETESITVDL